MQMKQMIDKIIKEELSKKNRLNEATIEKRNKYQGINYLIIHQVPHGYKVKGNDVESNDIFKGDNSWFDHIEDAIEHAEISIDSYLDDEE